MLTYSVKSLDCGTNRVSVSSDIWNTEPSLPPPGMGLLIAPTVRAAVLPLTSRRFTTEPTARWLAVAVDWSTANSPRASDAVDPATYWVRTA